MMPPRWTRTSEELLPPHNGRSLTNATLHPLRAALTAAHIPAIPPPTTTKSKCPSCFMPVGWSRLRNCWVNSVSVSNLSGSGEVERYTASHLPSKPVRSCSAMVLLPLWSLILPDNCHSQSEPVCPLVYARRFPLMNT